MKENLSFDIEDLFQAAWLSGALKREKLLFIFVRLAVDKLLLKN